MSKILHSCLLCKKEFFEYVCNHRKFCSKLCTDIANGQKMKLDYKEGRRMPSTIRPDVRIKISNTIKQLYQNGILFSPSTKPEIAKKIRDIRKSNGHPWHSKDTKNKISKTLKEGYQTNRIKPTNHSIEQRKQMSIRNKNLSISPRNTPITEQMFIQKLCDIGFIHQYKFIMSNPGNRGGRTYYVPDFTHLQYKICIEINGRDHNISRIKKKDETKQQYLQSLGFITLIFANEEVLNDVDNVFLTIKKYLP